MAHSTPRSFAPRGKNIRLIETPEGVPLSVTLADPGERLGAVLIDLLAIVLLMVAWSAALSLLALHDKQLAEWAVVLLILGIFIIHSFYFIFMELRWQGRTLGKLLLGIRVIDRKGGKLTSQAIFARNLMREIELFIPISLLASARLYDTDQWVLVTAGIWIGIFVLLPLFNNDRMRAGDLIGGTLVVEMPKAILLDDIVEESPTDTEAEFSFGYRFSLEQLSAYGVYELHTLEELLRRKGKAADSTAMAVAQRIQSKINWSDPWDATNPWGFLEDFYVAQRTHLEGRMLMGERKEHKDDDRGASP